MKKRLLAGLMTHQYINFRKLPVTVKMWMQINVTHDTRLTSLGVDAV